MNTIFTRTISSTRLTPTLIGSVVAPNQMKLIKIMIWCCQKCRLDFASKAAWRNSCGKPNSRLPTVSPAEATPFLCVDVGMPELADILGEHSESCVWSRPETGANYATHYFITLQSVLVTSDRVVRQSRVRIIYYTSFF